mgnify:CR=1 FL=1
MKAGVDDVRLPFPPVWMQRAGLALGSPLGRLVGYGATYEPAPIGEAEASALLDQLKGSALLGAFRGKPPADRAALARLMATVSRFAADHAAVIQEIELNPVLVHPSGHGLTVVDALIVRRQE